MAITAIITSALTARVIKQSALDAQENESEASALYTLTNRLTDAVDMPDIALIATNTISDIMESNAAIFFFDEYGKPEQTFIQQRDANNQVRRRVGDAAGIKHRMESLRTAYDVGSEFFDWSIYGRESIFGV